jgi:hypothetical protein
MSQGEKNLPQPPWAGLFSVGGCCPARADSVTYTRGSWLEQPGLRWSSSKIAEPAGTGAQGGL